MSGFVRDMERVDANVRLARETAERLNKELEPIGVKALVVAVEHATRPEVAVWLEADDEGPIATLPAGGTTAWEIGRLVRCYQNGFRAGRMYGRIDLQRQMRELLGAAGASEVIEIQRDRARRGEL